MCRIRNGQNVNRTVKERIYQPQRIKRISSDTCISHEVHSRYCVRDCYHFLNNNEKFRSFKSKENIHKKKVGPYRGFGY